jgi:hypothetical protein
MIITKPAARQEWWVGRKPICLHCTARLEIEAGDVPARIESPKDSTAPISAVFVCGHCGSDVTLLKRW